VPVTPPLKKKEVVERVVGSTASLKVAWIVEFLLTLRAPMAGTTDMTARETGNPVVICSGEVLVTVVLSPSSPAALSPHAQRVPSARRATVKSEPPATATQPRRSSSTGEAIPVVVPRPSWPFVLAPHAQRVLSDLRPMVKLEPAATADHVKEGT